MRAFLLLLLILLCSTNLYANPKTTDNQIFNNKIKLNQNCDQKSAHNIYKFEKSGIILFKNPTKIIPDFSNYWTSHANKPTSFTVIKYEGFHGLIYRQITRQINKHYRHNLQKYLLKTYDNPIDLEATIRQHDLEANDYQYHWWKRKSWTESLKQGGSVLTIHTIGHEHEISSLGPVSIKNTGRIAWDGWGLTLSHKREKPETKEEQKIQNNEKLSENLHAQRNFMFGIVPPKGNLLSFTDCALSGSVNIDIRLNQLNQDNGSLIKGNLKFKIYSKQNNKSVPTITIELKGTVRPFKESYDAFISITVLLG